MDQFEEFMTLQRSFRREGARALTKAVVIHRCEELLAACSLPSLQRAISEFLADAKEEQRLWKVEYEKKQQQERIDRLSRMTARLASWDSGQVPLCVCQELVKRSGWWLTHPSGHVRAPGHAKNLAKGAFGWHLELGANSFLVTECVRAAAAAVSPFVAAASSNPPRFFRYADATAAIVSVVPRCVANYRMDKFEFYAPSQGMLVFGAQGISVKDVSRYLVQASGIQGFADPFSIPR